MSLERSKALADVPLTIAGQTVFNELTVAEFSPLIELDASNGISPVYRDKLDPSPTGSAGIQETSEGEIEIYTGTTAGSKYDFQTQERGRYQPGIVGLPGQAFRVEGEPTGDAEFWVEYGDGIDALRVGGDANGKFLQYIHANTAEPRVYQGAWSNDNLDGQGGSGNPSGATLDFSDMNIYRKPFTDYGGGPGEVVILLTGPNGMPVFACAHTFTAAPGKKFFSNPKLPLRQYVDNGSTNDNLRLFIGGREFAVLGRYEPNRRQTTAFTGGEVSVSSTELKPIISFRKKQLRKWLSRSVKVSGVGLPSDADGVFEILLGADLDIDGTPLADGDWGDIERIPASETALEVNKTANGLTGGTRVDGGPMVSGGGNKFNLAGIRGLGVDIPDDVVVTVAVQTNSQSGNVFGAFSLEEEA